MQTLQCDQWMVAHSDFFMAPSFSKACSSEYEASVTRTGVPEIFQNANIRICKNAELILLVKGTPTQRFSTSIGVPQGYSLSPVLSFLNFTEASKHRTFCKLFKLPGQALCAVQGRLASLMWTSQERLIVSHMSASSTRCVA